MQYEYCEDGYSETFEADSLDEAIEWAENKLRDGDWGTSPETMWVSAIVEDEDGDRENVKVAIDPKEPVCPEGEHDWQSPWDVVGGLEENPGVWGNGGGVVIREVCVHCGRYKRTDTWAQDPETGEQGLTSVSYPEADEASQAWIDGN